jgi:hypothetical protein
MDLGVTITSTLLYFFSCIGFVIALRMLHRRTALAGLRLLVCGSFLTLLFPICSLIILLPAIGVVSFEWVRDSLPIFHVLAIPIHGIMIVGLLFLIRDLAAGSDHELRRETRS